MPSDSKKVMYDPELSQIKIHGNRMDADIAKLKDML